MQILSFQGEELSKVGSGLDREVYRINTTAFGEAYQGKMVKYAARPTAIDKNESEFQTWMAVNGTRAEQYFAPIRDRSKEFEFLIMDYAEPVGAYGSVDGFEEMIQEAVLLEDSSKYDIYAGNVGRHPSKGQVVIDYPWGGAIEIAEQ